MSLKKSKAKKKTKYEVVGIDKYKDRYLRYSDLPYEQDGFISMQSYRPYPFDMILLKIEGMRKAVPAWWDGKNWTGLRLRAHHKILAWKKHEDYV